MPIESLRRRAMDAERDLLDRGITFTVYSEATAIDLGGGLGVPEKPGQVPVDLAALQAVIDESLKLAGSKQQVPVSRVVEFRFVREAYRELKAK